MTQSRIATIFFIDVSIFNKSNVLLSCVVYMIHVLIIACVTGSKADVSPHLCDELVSMLAYGHDIIVKTEAVFPSISGSFFTEQTNYDRFTSLNKNAYTIRHGIASGQLVQRVERETFQPSVFEKKSVKNSITDVFFMWCFFFSNGCKEQESV